ncbi:16S rRNA methyltransferase [Skermanella stibiiresistens SB22]|uniref:Ribosomal RNA small subunit methyltransferase E n=1 Tax=Skermanella stibiiresistens SB22 TaxID=1385369 RepID=W9H021_9PROT|nr:16S rRNA (uracil(1498)-N(3))-methyltransferase [Skermanella stibiiresistens]EWY38156.1 16S rRNA methyltransferase [Skermanella stibiiresistens SB22]
MTIETETGSPEAPPKTRLHVDEPLAAGATVGLDHERAHYLRHVLRLDRGDRVALFNGRDGEWSARIDGFGKGWCSLAVDRQRRPQAPEPDLWLLFAPIKRTRIDFVAEKAAELGASVVWPVLTRHTDVARVNVDRLRANAIEAAEQCERLTVPDLREPAKLDQVTRDWSSDRTILLCAEAGPVKPIAAAVAGLKPGPVAILTGPEGGFAKDELDGLLKLPFVVPVGLGPRILRADTAALAALACWQALAGDWATGGADARPPFRSQEPG